MLQHCLASTLGEKGARVGGEYIITRAKKIRAVFNNSFIPAFNSEIKTYRSGLNVDDCMGKVLDRIYTGQEGKDSERPSGWEPQFWSIFCIRGPPCKSFPQLSRINGAGDYDETLAVSQSAVSQASDSKFLPAGASSPASTTSSASSVVGTNRLCRLSVFCSDN